MKKNILFMMVLICIITSNHILSAQNNTDDKSALKFSITERLRLETWDNTVGMDESLSDASTYTRTRTSIGAEWQPDETLRLVCKLTNEFRYYVKPEDREFTLHEVFFDQLYLQLINPFGLPGSLTLGRQNIQLGEGFLVMDGGPLDGSRSAYFNGARLDLNICDKGTVTLFYVYQSESDRFLPLINDQSQMLVEQPEEGYSVYYSGKICEVKLDAYYIHKNIYESVKVEEESSIDTFGARAVLNLTSRLELTTEAAVQSGDKGEAERKAFGGYFHVDYKTGLDVGLPDLVTLGGIYLSGDDPATSRWEGWDPLFSRWPKWSDSLIYAFIRESKVAYWSNFISMYASLRFPLWEDASLNFAYHHLKADEPSPEGSVFPGGDGTTRGNLLISRLNFKINPELSGHILWEYFIPGDFYFDEADSYNWFRIELFYQM